MTLQLCQGSLGRSIRLEKKEEEGWRGEVGCERGPRAGKSGRLVCFCESVCGDEEWEGGKVNTRHSLSLMHVLLSGWKT